MKLTIGSKVSTPYGVAKVVEIDEKYGARVQYEASKLYGWFSFPYLTLVY